MKTKPSKQERVAKAFEIGGYVTAYEADEYMRQKRGTIRGMFFGGQIKGLAETYGKNRMRILVHTNSVKRAFGVHKHSA